MQAGRTATELAWNHHHPILDEKISVIGRQIVEIACKKALWVTSHSPEDQCFKMYDLTSWLLWLLVGPYSHNKPSSYSLLLRLK